jgi:hypothetical protein
VRERVDKRTKNSKTFELEAGKFRVIIYGSPIHYEDDQGNLLDISTDIFDEACFDEIDFPVSVEVVAHDSKQPYGQTKQKVNEEKQQGIFSPDSVNYRALKLPFDAQIPRFFDRGYSISKGEDCVKFVPIGANKIKANVEGSKATYPSVWNDTDVTLELTNTGVKETITLLSINAPTVFKFEVEGLETATELKLQPPWLEDANGTRRDVTQNIIQRDGKTFVELVADVTELKYPVRIDPTVVIGSPSEGIQDTYVRNLSPNSTFYGTQLICSRTSTAPDAEQYQILIGFPLDGLPTGAEVQSAYLRFYQGYNTVNNIKLTLTRITTPWDAQTVTWNTRPTRVPADDFVTDLSRFKGYKDISVTNTLINVVENQLDFYGFLLYVGYYDVPSMLDSYSSRHTNSNYRPSVFIDYIAPPTAPTLTSPNGGETWTGEQYITWNPATDEDVAQNLLQYQIQLSRDNGVTWTDIVTLTTAGATSYVYDFSGVAESSTCLVRIRAYNGTVYGDYDISDATFTIQHSVHVDISVPVLTIPTLLVAPSYSLTRNPVLSIPLVQANLSVMAPAALLEWGATVSLVTLSLIPLTPSLYIQSNPVVQVPSVEVPVTVNDAILSIHYDIVVALLELGLTFRDISPYVVRNPLTSVPAEVLPLTMLVPSAYIIPFIKRPITTVVKDTRVIARLIDTRTKVVLE